MSGWKCRWKIIFKKKEIINIKRIFFEINKNIREKLLFFVTSIAISLFFIMVFYVFLNLWKISKNFTKSYLYMNNITRNSLYVFIDEISFRERDLLEIKEILNRDVELVYGGSFRGFKVFFVDKNFLKSELMIDNFEKFDCLIPDSSLNNEEFVNLIRDIFKEKNLIISYKRLYNPIYVKSVFVNRKFQNDFLLPIKPQFIRVILKNQTEIKKIKVDIINYFISKYNKRILVYNPNEYMKRLIVGFVKLGAFLTVLGLFYFIFLSLFLFKFISDILKIFIKRYLCYDLIGFSKTYIFILIFLDYFLIFLISFLFSSYLLKGIFLNFYMFVLSFLVSLFFIVFTFVFVYKREYVNNKISY